MSVPALPIFLTARDVADMLRVDERTVLRWAQQDASMPATRLGRVVRFEREPLLRWLARKQPRGSPDVAGDITPPTWASLSPWGRGTWLQARLALARRLDLRDDALPLRLAARMTSTQ